MKVLKERDTEKLIVSSSKREAYSQIITQSYYNFVRTYIVYFVEL
jgi:hypothetical protein